MDEPSHAREWRWPADFEINVNTRHPVMRVVMSLDPEMLTFNLNDLQMQ
jgi:hypothetical protein